MTKDKFMEKVFVFVLLAVYLVTIFSIVKADPVPASDVTLYDTETMGASGSIGYNVSYTGNGSIAGGYIFIIRIDSKVQNKRWKAFVGNVSGRLTLDDSDGYTIFDWSQFTGSVTGEVYATRFSTPVNWSNINCTWGYRRDPNEYQNKTVIEYENTALAFNSSDDNITTTFSQYNHSLLQVGSIAIPANNCSSLRTYVNSSSYNQDIFTEVILYDGYNDNDGRIIYATFIDETDLYSYRNDSITSYDFQMIVPENASPTWNSQTSYYFYLELEE